LRCLIGRMLWVAIWQSAVGDAAAALPRLLPACYDAAE
jgi:hypothetical protein